MFKIKHERIADCVVAGYRVHKSGADAIGSLLLGLYKDDGTLASVGVIGAFPMTGRARLFTELQPFVTGFEGYPWDWAAHEAGERTPAETKRPAGRRQGPVVRAAATRSRGRGPLRTTWKANGSATPPSSTVGAPTATHARAPTPNSSARLRSALVTSFPALARATPDEVRLRVTRITSCHVSAIGGVLRA
jgi:hypothetical protein